MIGSDSAFPKDRETDANGNIFSYETYGLTVRYWLAGHAYVPWNAVVDDLEKSGETMPTIQRILERRSEIRFMEADAMLLKGM